MIYNLESLKEYMIANNLKRVNVHFAGFPNRLVGNKESLPLDFDTVHLVGNKESLPIDFDTVHQLGIDPDGDVLWLDLIEK